MNHQNQLEQMANWVMFAKRWKSPTAYTLDSEIVSQSQAFQKWNRDSSVEAAFLAS
jgi:hypothetical protein